MSGMQNFLETGGRPFSEATPPLTMTTTQNDMKGEET